MSLMEKEIWTESSDLTIKFPDSTCVRGAIFVPERLSRWKCRLSSQVILTNSLDIVLFVSIKTFQSCKYFCVFVPAGIEILNVLTTNTVLPLIAANNGWSSFRIGKVVLADILLGVTVLCTVNLLCLINLLYSCTSCFYNMNDHV